MNKRMRQCAKLESVLFCLEMRTLSHIWTVLEFSCVPRGKDLQRTLSEENAVFQARASANAAFPGKVHFLSDRGIKPVALFSNLHGLQVIASKLCVLVQLWLR